MLDELGWCARNPPVLLGGGMASSSCRRRPLGPCRRRAPFRSRETDFATPAERPTKPNFEQFLPPLFSATLKLRSRTGPSTRDQSRLLTGSMLQSLGLGAMFTRRAISPIEVVDCVTFPQEPVQSDSMNRAFAARKGAVR